MSMTINGGINLKHRTFTLKDSFADISLNFLFDLLALLHPILRKSHSLAHSYYIATEVLLVYCLKTRARKTMSCQELSLLLL